MSRIAYVAGRYLLHRAARVHIEDRGYQFADGIYEVIAVRNGRMIDEIPHLDRLDRSLGEMRMVSPLARAPLRHALREVVRRNRVRDGIVYLQMTRGVAPRDHAFPKAATPVVVITAKRMAPKTALMQSGVAAVSVPDIRWKRRDIKAIGLAPNVLAKQQAVEAGAYEALLVDENGVVSEGTTTNAWIVTPARELVTHQASASILNGVTRVAVLGLAQKQGYRMVERPFTLDEARAAAEVFLTGTTTWVMPIVTIDGRPVGGGKPGPLTLALQRLYSEHADRA